MEQKLGRAPAIGLTLIAATAAWFLRKQQLLNAFDESGKVLADANTSGFAWFCVLFVAVFAIYCFFLKPQETYQTISGKGPITLLMTFAASFAMIAGRLAVAMKLEQTTDLLLAAGGIIAAICWGVVGLDRFRGRKVPAALFMVPALYFAVELIWYFRNWSRDPQILDYCFDLLALISVMCATFHLGGFCFDKGKRRITAFFCFCGIFFCAAAMAEGSFSSIAIHGGSILWLLTNLSQLLRPIRKRRERT